MSTDHMTAEQLRAELEKLAHKMAEFRCAGSSMCASSVHLYMGQFAEQTKALAARLSGMAADGLGLPVLAYDAGNDVRIEVAQQPYCTKWKVTNCGNVLANDGIWEWEPMPSSRDAAFLSRCRFDTPQAALACLKATTEPPHV